MLNDKVDVEIYGRKMTLEMDGMTQLELSAIAKQVDGLMREIGRESKIVDSSKLAILTAIEIAADLQKLKARMEDLDKFEGQKVDGMIVDLEKTVESD